MPWRSCLAHGEPGPRVELDLTVLEGGVEVEQDDQAVVDAGPPDAPLVHQRGGVRLGLVGRDVVAAERLRVDDDLGLGLRLDGIDDRLGLTLGGPREDPGVVVDRLAVDRFGERRSAAGARARATRRRQARRRERPARDGGEEGERLDGIGSWRSS